MTTNFEWYYQMPTIFKLVIIAICIMLILMAIISGIYYLPKKNKDMKTEILNLDKEIVKKKITINLENEKIIQLQDKRQKELDEHIAFKSETMQTIEDLQKQKEELEKQVESLKKKVGGRPKKKPDDKSNKPL